VIVLRKFIFKDTKKNKEMVLPVTPPSFEVSHGINIETINIHTLGDVILPGYGTLSAIKVNCMFPARKYSFNQSGTKLDPYDYIEKIITWCDNHTILRLIVSDTAVNVQVVISDISYGEKDGTGDVYATISLREYRKLTVVQTNKTGNKVRGVEKTTTSKENYVIKSGDTLGAICRKYYGNASLSTKLAAYNGIKNSNLIYVGNTLKLPDKNLL
jgi:LysM repeat protein